MIREWKIFHLTPDRLCTQVLLQIYYMRSLLSEMRYKATKSCVWDKFIGLLPLYFLVHYWHASCGKPNISFGKKLVIKKMLCGGWQVTELFGKQTRSVISRITTGSGSILWNALSIISMGLGTVYSLEREKKSIIRSLRWVRSTTTR